MGVCNPEGPCWLISCSGWAVSPHLPPRDPALGPTGGGPTISFSAASSLGTKPKCPRLAPEALGSQASSKPHALLWKEDDQHGQ